MAKSWWEPNFDEKSPVWVTSLENPENNQRYMVSSIEDTINSVQKSFVRESLTTSNLSTIFPNRHKLCYPKNPPHPLLQKSVPIGSRGMEYRTVFHESLMTMYQDHIIDNRILFPGAAMVELGLAAGTRWMGDIPEASNE